MTINSERLLRKEKENDGHSKNNCNIDGYLDFDGFRGDLHGSRTAGT
jgi:hypothetical protein